MKTMKAVAVAIALAGTVIVPLTLAQADSRHDGRPGAPGERMRHGYLAQRFADLDTDNDGKLTQAEIYAKRSADFAAIDTNGDGAVSAEELDASHKARRLEHVQRMLQTLDTDGDGKVTKEEFARARLPGLSMLMARGDGTVTEEQLKQLMDGPKHHGRQHRRHAEPKPN